MLFRMLFRMLFKRLVHFSLKSLLYLKKNLYKNHVPFNLKVSLSYKKTPKAYCSYKNLCTPLLKNSKHIILILERVHFYFKNTIFSPNFIINSKKTSTVTDF